ncbi:MAG: ABC transporter permease subunit [Gammaproteobacteria bacterium]
MSKIWPLYKREFKAYFVTPIAYIFMVIFLLLCGLLTFYAGLFFQRGQADLQPFFEFHPWIYLIFVPALSMRLWAEERKSGTFELLLTLPLSPIQAVLGKFLAAWTFAGLTLLLTFPFWITVNYLGEPDNGTILLSYIASFILAGSFLSIGTALSAFTKNQVIAFISTLSLGLLFVLSGFPIVTDFFYQWVPTVIVNAIRDFSFMTNFETMTKGVIDLRHIVFFTTFIGIFLFINTLALEAKKAD